MEFRVQLVENFVENTIIVVLYISLPENTSVKLEFYVIWYSYCKKKKNTSFNCKIWTYETGLVEVWESLSVK